MMLEVLAKEFERYANIAIPEFLKIGIVIRQAEEGPMRTHFIMNSHRSATFQDIKTEVTNLKQAQSAVMARPGDAMDVDAFTKGSKGVSKGSGKKQDSEGVSRRVIEIPNVARSRRTTKVDSRGVPRGDSKGKNNKKEFKGRCHKFWQDWSHVEGLQIQRNECIRSWRRLSRHGCIEMASIFLNAPEIGAVLPAEDPSLRHGTRCIFTRSDRNIKAQAYHEGNGMKLEFERANRVFELPVEKCSIQPEFVEEEHFRSVLFTVSSGTDGRCDGQGCDCGPPTLTEACSAASPTEEALLQLLVSVGGSFGSRDMS